MSHIFYELHSIPVPEGGHVHTTDNVVVVYEYTGTERHKKSIGKFIPAENKMYPNEYFKFVYRNIWAEQFGGGKVLPEVLYPNLYAMTLGVGYSLGVYPIVLSSYGDLYANALMDYGMFSIRDRSNAVYLMRESMESQVLFSRKCPSDDFYSELFNDKITGEMNHNFRMRWIENRRQALIEQAKVEAKAQAKAKGIKFDSKDLKVPPGKIWLCVDGSNINCTVADSETAEMGHAKSGKQITIVSFIWAVDTTGMPITWFVNNGGMPDNKAFDEMIKFLSSSGFQVEGVIMDRGFATLEILEKLDELGFDYVIMLKSDCDGYAEMMKRHAATIRWKVDHIINDDGLFGLADTVKVFKNQKSESLIGLYFNGAVSSKGFHDLGRKVRAELKKLRLQLRKDPQKASVSDDMRPYVKLVQNQTGDIEINVDFPVWQTDSDASGFFAIATKKLKTAEQIDATYSLRDASEKQFSVFKSQLGDNVARQHTDKGVKNRLAAGFIAAILRFAIQQACKKLELDTNVMIKKLGNRGHFRYMPGDYYQAIRDTPADVKKLLAQYGIKEDHIQKMALEVNQQNAGETLPIVRKIPDLGPKPRNKGGRKATPKTEKVPEVPATVQPQSEQQPVKRGRGRPKGSLSKSTLERLAREAANPTPPKRRGRPKGSRNKSTEAKLKAEAERKQKRGVGRPKGSKDKTPRKPRAKTGKVTQTVKKLLALGAKIFKK